MAIVYRYRCERGHLIWSPEEMDVCPVCETPVTTVRGPGRPRKEKGSKPIPGRRNDSER